MFRVKSLQNLRSSKQREKLLSVAGNLFWEKGYLGTSIDEIAKASKVNKALIYYYFKSKNHILFEIATKYTEGLIKQTLPIVESNMSTEEKLRSFVFNHILFVLKNLELPGGGRERRCLGSRLLKIYIGLRDKYEGMFRKILEEGEDKGIFQCRDMKLTSLFILGFLNNISFWYKPTGRFRPEELAQEAYIFISKALQLNKDSISELTSICSPKVVRDE
jgi:AcrR family transcriptional regulator